MEYCVLSTHRRFSFRVNFHGRSFLEHFIVNSRKSPIVSSHSVIDHAPQPPPPTNQQTAAAASQSSLQKTQGRRRKDPSELK
ncbi:unnamed protein product, partial [Nesidiocoris tenuis]